METDNWIEVDDLEPGETPKQSLRVVIGAAAASGVALIALSLLAGDAPVAVTTTADMELAAPPAGTISASLPPIALAAAFVDAYGRFDLEQAAGYLAEHPNLTQLECCPWKRGNRWLQALAFDLQLESCAGMGNSPAGDKVRCEFDFHVFGSESWRQTPFVGWFDFNILDGTIASAALTWNTEAVWEEAFEPFYSWLDATHPTDVSAMYQWGNPLGTDESISLWEQRTRQFAEAAGRIDDDFVSQVRAICARALARWTEQSGGYDVVAAQALDEAIVELRSLTPPADPRGNQARMIGLVERLATELRNPTSEFIDVLHLVERQPGMQACTFRGPR